MNNTKQTKKRGKRRYVLLLLLLVLLRYEGRVTQLTPLFKQRYWGKAAAASS